MKFHACVCALFICGVANAGTEIDLPSPDVFAYYSNPNCHYSAPAHTAANGFSADGNYVLGISHGYIACGHSGRGSNLIYTRYCMLDTWDLSGNLVSVVTQPYAGCPAENIGTTWTSPSGYEAYTVTTYIYGYIQSRYVVLATP